MNPPIPQANGQPATPAAIRAAAQVAVAFYAKYRADLKAARAYLDEYDLLLAQADEGRDIRIINERKSLAELLGKMRQLSEECRAHGASYEQKTARQMPERKLASSKGKPMLAARNRLQSAEDNLTAYRQAAMRVFALAPISIDIMRSANELLSSTTSTLMLARQQFSREQSRCMEKMLP